jgi:translation initiation factor IF-1
MTDFSFTTKLERLPNNLAYTALFLPYEILAQLPEKGRLRIAGKLNGVIPFNLAILNLKEGPKYLMIGSQLRKEAKIKEGDLVQVSFQLVDSKLLEIPEELLIALEQDDIAKEIFDTLTIGYKRSLIHYITATKNIDIRIKRALTLLEKIKTNTLNTKLTKIK